VVQPRVDELDGLDRPAEDPAQLRDGGGVAAERVAGDEDGVVALRCERQRVAGPLVVELLRKSIDLEPVVGEPRRVDLRLALPLRVAEVARHELQAVDDAGIGREDEVGHLRLRVHRHHLRAGEPQGRDEVLPLLRRQVVLDGHLLVHPRVDLVEHPEVVGRAHEVAPPPRQLCH
jgi:hypothetical protein